MNRPFETFTKDIFASFKALDLKSYHEVINFYETNHAQIQHLYLDEYTEILLAYSNALFETGDYKTYSKVATQLIEMIIMHDIDHLEHENLFERVLFKKAAAHYHLFELDDAEKILWELLKMNPSNSIAAYLLRKCRTKNQPLYLRWAKAVSIVMFLLAAFIIALELLLVQPFFAEHEKSAQTIRFSVFFGGISLLILAETTHRIVAYHSVSRTISEIKFKKIHKSLNV